jgi:hypothetical protein
MKRDDLQDLALHMTQRANEFSIYRERARAHAERVHERGVMLAVYSTAGSMISVALLEPVAAMAFSAVTLAAVGWAAYDRLAINRRFRELSESRLLTVTDVAEPPRQASRVHGPN